MSGKSFLLIPVFLPAHLLKVFLADRTGRSLDRLLHLTTELPMKHPDGTIVTFIFAELSNYDKCFRPPCTFEKMY